MTTRPGTWAVARCGLLLALLVIVASGLSYPGDTARDESTHGYSFTHNFLSDLGTTGAFRSSTRAFASDQSSRLRR